MPDTSDSPVTSGSRVTSDSPGTRDSVDDTRDAWATVRPELDTTAIAVLGRIHRLSRAVTLLSDALLEPFGIGRGEFDVLSVLRRSDSPVTATRLAHLLTVSNAAITKRMLRLEASGLAERQRSSHDKRVVLVDLTPAGRDLIDAALPAQLGLEAEIADVLGCGDRDATESALRRLLVEAERRLNA